MPDQRKVFFGSLDSLRGVAALLVAVYHVSWVNPILNAGLVRNSYLMVDLFFVISGFVICHSYGDRIRNRGELRDFVVLRLGRLYPLHVVMLCVFMTREVAKYGALRWLNYSSQTAAFAHDNGWAFASNLLLIHAFGLPRRLTFNTPSWSISTEFYTYVVFGVVVLAMRNLNKTVQLASFLTISALSFAVLLLVGRQDLNVMTEMAWFRCGLGFFLGAASYTLFARSDLLRHPKAQRLASYVGVAGLISGMLFLEFKASGRSDFVFPLLAALVVVVLSASPDTGINRWLQIRPLAYLGKRSYSIYMVHYALLYQFSSVLIYGFGFETHTDETGGQFTMTGQVTGTIVLMLYIASVLLVSHVTFAYIEEPFRLKAKAWIARRQARRSDAERVRAHEQFSDRPVALIGN